MLASKGRKETKRDAPCQQRERERERKRLRKTIEDVFIIVLFCHVVVQAQGENAVETMMCLSSVILCYVVVKAQGENAVETMINAMKAFPNESEIQRTAANSIYNLAWEGMIAFALLYFCECVLV